MKLLVRRNVYKERTEQKYCINYAKDVNEG